MTNYRLLILSFVLVIIAGYFQLSNAFNNSASNKNSCYRINLTPVAHPLTKYKWKATNNSKLKGIPVVDFQIDSIFKGDEEVDFFSKEAIINVGRKGKKGGTDRTSWFLSITGNKLKFDLNELTMSPNSFEIPNNLEMEYELKENGKLLILKSSKKQIATFVADSSSQVR